MSIDWAPHDRWSENTITCGCGAVFRSHSKCVVVEEKVKLVTRKPCPACGHVDRATKVSSDPERFDI